MSLLLVFFVGILSLVDSTTYDSSQDEASIVESFAAESQKLSTPEECARQCVQGEQPKTCYYHFTVEYFATMTQACTLCSTNTTTRLKSDCQCITADGYETSSIITVNRMYPGPAIMICLNDFVIVDVTNRIPANGLTIHWHGLFQKSYQHYDGVPYVTQCPISEGSTFRYQWRANNPGTHFWHSHVGLQKVDGLAGALIVRQPKTSEPYNYLWDSDELDNVIIVSDFLHDGAENHFPGTQVRRSGQKPDNFLINGLGQWTDRETGQTTSTPLARITVKSGRRYRFRLINSCGFTCAVRITIQDHNLTVIATDGLPIVPVTANSITSSSAERYDFVLTTNKKPGHYWIQVQGLGRCNITQQLAVLSYRWAAANPNLTRPPHNIRLDPGTILNALNVRCSNMMGARKFICLDQLESADPIPSEIMKEIPDVKIYVPFGFYVYTTEEIFEPGTYKRYLFATNYVTATVGNISNVLPPSPFLSQRKDIPDDQICTNKKLPAKCQNQKPCECYHVEKIPLNAVVELILVDEAQVQGLSHPFHLHGHAFYVIGQARGADHNITSINLKKVMELDRRGMTNRHRKRYVSKDTYAVPNNGYSIIRFQAVNPGYWLFHCHFVFHLEVGMSLIFQVGEPSDMPRNPKRFPKCRDFVPPIHKPYL